MCNQPEILQGDSFSDERGNVSYVNDLSFTNIKRFYTIEHNKDNVIRAWQAHKHEEKFFFPLEGAFIVHLIPIDDWNNPSQKMEPYTFNLNTESCKLLRVPKGYANGFINTKPKSKLLIFSTSSLNESKTDDIRFGINYFPKVIW